MAHSKTDPRIHNKALVRSSTLALVPLTCTLEYAMSPRTATDTAVRCTIALETGHGRRRWDVRLDSGLRGSGLACVFFIFGWEWIMGTDYGGDA